jgi:predicted alpha/beta hydrolase
VMQIAKKVPGSEIITITARDGYRLAATRFEAVGRRVVGHLIVAGATGVPQRFYQRFARYISQRGFTVLTLDYRGIGESRQSSLKGFQADFLDWAGLDLAAAVDEMTSESVPLYMVGHSFGGQALGLLPNHHLIKGHYTFAVGAGWHGWMPFSRESSNTPDMEISSSYPHGLERVFAYVHVAFG